MNISDGNKRFDILLCIAAVYYIFYSFLQSNTMFAQQWNAIYGIPLRLYHISEVIILFFAILAVITEEKRERQLLYTVLILTGMVNMTMLLIMWPAFAGRSMRFWMRLGAATTLIMFAFTIISALTGHISMYGHDNGPLAYGMINRTNFSFTVLFLIISFGVLKKGRFRFYTYIILYLITAITFYLVTAKNSMICTVLFITLCLAGQLYDRFIHNEKISRVFTGIQKYFLDYSFIIAYGLFRLLVGMKDKLGELVPKYPFLGNFVLRLDTAQRTADMPFSLFGRHIAESGNEKNYFVVDSFMARSPAMDGLIVFVILMLVFTYFMIRARRLKAHPVYFAFMVMALYAITDPSFTGPDLNFLIALPFACWDVYMSKAEAEA